jgi:hypothetical protein
MHELLQYLNRLGAATFLTVAQHGLVGNMKVSVDVHLSRRHGPVLRLYLKRSAKCGGDLPA